MDKIDLIKLETKKVYVRNYSTDAGILVSKNPLYNRQRSSLRSAMVALTKVLKPVNVLEIGSFHYETTNVIASTMDEIFGIDGGGIVDSFDIRIGGYDGEGQLPDNKRIRAHFWLAHRTNYDGWKYQEGNVLHDEFLVLKNEDIFKRNLEYLKSTSPPNGYDLIFIDGDHSADGIRFDWRYALNVCHPETVVVFDDINDDRHPPVRMFYDSLPTKKYAFEDWAEEGNPQAIGVALTI